MRFGQGTGGDQFLFSNGASSTIRKGFYVGDNATINHYFYSGGNQTLGAWTEGVNTLVIGTGRDGGGGSLDRVLFHSTGVGNMFALDAPTSRAYLYLPMNAQKSRFNTTSTQLGANETLTTYNNDNSFSVSAVNTAGANAATIGVWNQATSGDNKFLEFYTEGTVTSRGSITYNRGSGVVAYNTTSDYRAKKEVRDLDSAISKVMALKPKSYFMLDGTRRTNGFFAHELQQVLPQAVTGVKDAVDSTGKPIYQQVDLSQIIPVLTKAIQEQQKEIESERAKRIALEARLAKIEELLKIKP